MSHLKPEKDDPRYHADSAASGNGENPSWNPARLPLFPSESSPGSTPIEAPQAAKEPLKGTELDAGLSANKTKPTRNSSVSTGSSAGSTTKSLDWEHLDRQPSGSSIIDPNSVYDDSGRSFHGYKQGKYFLPNDAVEQDRLDLQHAGYLLLLDGKLGLAPVENPEYVLDIATGTGIWAMQYAEQHSGSQVIGTDLSDIQPKWKLPNCSFVQDDAEEEWLFGSSELPIQFDYVHLRLVFTCFDNPRQVIRNAYRNLTPGGWIEYLDGSFNWQSMDNNLDGTALKRLVNLVSEGLAKHGRDAEVAEHYAEWLREEGFVDIVDETLSCPGNPWPEDERLKQCGRFMLANALQGFRGGSWKLLKSLGLTSEEIEELINQAKKDASSRQYRWYWPVRIVYARKPFDHEVSASSGETKISVKKEGEADDTA